MPLSGVVDASKNMRPEWREYIGTVQMAATLLKTLTAQAGGAAVIEERLNALTARIIVLSKFAGDDTDRLVMWRGTSNDSAGSQHTFQHDLGTQHVFWHIWDPVSHRTFPSFMTRVHDQSDAHITISNSDYDPAPAGMDAVFIGVISDRY